MEKPSCHEETPTTGRGKKSKSVTQHPSHANEKKRLNRIRGQLDGIDRMIDERRYCIDIVTQIKAAKSALESLEKSVLETHLRGCVQDPKAFQSINCLSN